jgi:cobalt/nickel transport system permease protein
VNQVNPSRRPKSRKGFIERSLIDINNALEQSFFAEKIARENGLLQNLDPRLKIVSLLLLLLAASLSRSLSVIAGLYFCTLILAAASKIPIGFFIKRVWVLIPFFTGIIALPALFITPGPALAQLPFGIVITHTGMMTTLFLILRVGTSVSFATLLILTTRWNSTLKALGVLHLPDVIVLTLGMTYRYIHLFLRTTNDMFLSRNSRIMRRMSSSEERQLMGATTGALLGKSLHLSSEVYLAMESRGFRGYPRTLDTFKMRQVDWISMFVVALITVSSIWLGR